MTSLKPIFVGLLGLTVGLVSACRSGDPELGDGLIPVERLQLEMVDTFTVTTATVRIDTFATTADSTLLVGQWTDPLTGTFRARSFMTFSFPANTLIDRALLRYDSLVLILPYAYHYGDTTQVVNWAAHPLQSPVEVGETYDNLDELPYQPTPLASATLRPRPTSGTKSLRLRLPETLGRTLFERMRSREINDRDTFEALLPGLALLAQPAGNAVYGFRSTGCLIRMYLHEASLERTEEMLDFPLIVRHFSQLRNDFAGTPLQALQRRQDAVSSDQTGEQSFVWVGAGLRTRLTIPYLAELKRQEKFISVNHAELVISPIRKSIRDHAPPPAGLLLYQTNRFNELLSPVTTFGGAAVQAGYAVNATNLELDDQYAFNVTDHVLNVLNQRIENRTLLIVPAEAQGRPSTERLALGNRHHPTDKIRLRIYYTRLE